MQLQLRTRARTWNHQQAIDTPRTARKQWAENWTGQPIEQWDEQEKRKVLEDWKERWKRGRDRKRIERMDGLEPTLAAAAKQSLKIHHQTRQCSNCTLDSKKQRALY
jgi:hypothetical protein